MALKFLQIADTHLGASLKSLPAEIADQLRRTTRDLMAEAFAAAANEDIELVLMPGDLFEQDGVDPAAQLRFIYEQAETVAPVPVVIAPGNHDAYSPQSPYAIVSAPGNVVLFTSSELTAVKTPAAKVAGRAVQAGERSSALQWSMLRHAANSDPSILILHASVLGAGDGRLRRNTVVPMTEQMLLGSGYSYTALGHYHRYQAWQRPGEEFAAAAYAGCLQGLGWDEPGPRGYLTGKLEPQGAQLTFHPLAKHIWHRCTVALPPEHLEDAESRLLVDLQAIYDEVGPDDLLELTVSGRWPASRRTELQQILERISGDIWHARPTDLSRVDFFLPLVGRGASDAVDAFIDLCDARLEELREEDETMRQALHLARYLGLRLLSGQGLPEEVA